MTKLRCRDNEIQHPRRKNVIINYDILRGSTGFNSYDNSQTVHHEWVEKSLRNEQNEHESHWTESIATGSNTFESIMTKLNVRARGRKVIEANDAYQIREDILTYNVLFDAKKSDIGLKNTHFWDDFIVNLED
jgi:putative transposase